MDKAMKKAERALNRTTGTSDSKAKQAHYEMKTAEMYWKDLQKKYPDTVSHPDVVAANVRMDVLNKKIISSFYWKKL